MSILNFMSGLMVGFAIAMMRYDQEKSILGLFNLLNVIAPLSAGMLIGFLAYIIFL